MFAIAYRMLGSVSEAEDVAAGGVPALPPGANPAGTGIDSPKAFLSAVTTRLCIDELRSARARREAYPGEWLPEPLLTADAAVLAGPPPDDPAAAAEQADTLSMAFLLLLERLSPVERAVFLLHDVFSYGYDEVASIVGKSEDNCRQLALRARRHVADGKPRFEASRGKRDELAATFFRAVRTGIWTAWSACWPRTSSWSATTLVSSRAGRVRSSAGTASAGCWSGWVSRSSRPAS